MPYFYVSALLAQKLRTPFLSLLALLFICSKTSAQHVAVVSGAWSDNSTWSPSGPPAAGESISIASGVTLLVDAAYSIQSLQVNNGSSASPAVLSFASGSQLTVAGYVSLGATNGAAGSIDMTAGGTLSVAGFAVEPLSSGNTFTAGTGTVLLNGNNTLPPGFANFYNLTIQGGTPGDSRTTTAGADLSVSNTLTIAASSVLNMDLFTLSLPGATLVNSGQVQTKNTSGAPLPSGQTWGDVVAGTGTVLYNADGGGQTIMAGNYNNLYVSHANGGSSSASGTIVIGGQVASLTTGTELNMGAFKLDSDPLGGIGAQFNVGTIRTQYVGAGPADLAIPSGRSWGGTILFDAAAGGQKIVFGTYNNLAVSTSGTDESSSIVVNGNFVTSAGSTIDLNQETLTGTFDATGHKGNLIVRGTTPFPAGKSFGGTVTYDGTVAQTVRNGTYNNLSITTFRSFDLTLESGTISVGGNFDFSAVLENGAVFQTAGATLNFSGSGLQNINVTARQIGPTVGFVFGDIQLTGGGRKVLLSPVFAGGNISFTNGVLGSSNSALLTLNAGATVSGGSIASYVEGPVRRIGTTAFTFPLGGAGVYAPLGISAPGANGDFTARYVRSNPHALGTNMQTPVVNISACEYWNLVKNAGDNNPFVTLGWSAESGCNGVGYIANLAHLVTVRFDGAAWVSIGNGGTTGNTQAGTINSNPLTDFDNITLGTTSGDNLLPVRFISVSASPRGSAVDLRWTTAAEFNVARYEVMRSSDGRNFAAIAQQPAVAGQSQYAATDLQPLQAPAYYRIQAVDADGRVTLSQVVRVRNSAVTAAIELYPVPVRNGALLVRSESLAAGAYELRVYDGAGRVVSRETMQHAGGALSRSVQLPLAVAPGQYHLLLSGAGQQTTASFVVQ